MPAPPDGGRRHTIRVIKNACNGRQRRLGVAHSQVDVSAAHRELGFRPQVSLEEGLRLTLDWLGR
jgi:nucleoside-diphosphate-sugar epimerase